MLGRMVRDNNGKLVAIVEAKDCTKEQFDSISEYNAATYIFNCRDMFEALKKLGYKVGLISNCYFEEAAVIKDSVLCDTNGFLSADFSILDMCT